LTEAHVDEEKIAIEEDNLNHELENLLNELEQFTEQAAETVAEHEHSAVLTLFIISLFAVIVSALSAFFITRSITQPMNLMLATAIELDQGDG
jgi:methyl-accepting chemotaxis protein